MFFLTYLNGDQRKEASCSKCFEGFVRLLEHKYYELREPTSFKDDMLCWAVARYKLKYLPEENLIIATLPGPVTASIEAPHGWPMPGFTLHLKSLIASSKARDLKPAGILEQCVVRPLLFSPFA